MDRKEYQNNWKKDQRNTNSDYAQKVRISKNSEVTKKRRKELRQSKASKEKEMLYQREYRKRPEVKAKSKARNAVKSALVNGILKRPDSCEVCKTKDLHLKDGRTGLRADHYLGYGKENYLNVKFICTSCDGKQLRKYDYSD